MLNFLKTINQSINIKKKLITLEKEVNCVINILYKCLMNDAKIMICGNGGSAADAQHLSAEFVDRLRTSTNRKPIPILCLALDSSHLTACGNDFSFNDIFERPLQAFGKKEDVLLVISTSGNSKNIIKVLRRARNMNIKSIALLGKGGGLAKKYADNSLVVKSNNTARIQECHIFLGHFILESVERKILKK